MILDEFLSKSPSIRFSGMELLGLYCMMIAMEDRLDSCQLRMLETVRSELYANFTIEEFELLENSYRNELRGEHDRQKE